MGMVAVGGMKNGETGKQNSIARKENRGALTRHWGRPRG
jgi:hypothetical protein